MSEKQQQNVEEDKHLETWIKNEMGCVTGLAVLQKLKEQEEAIEWLSKFFFVDDVGYEPEFGPSCLGWFIRHQKLEEELGCPVSGWDTSLYEQVRYKIEGRGLHSSNSAIHCNSDESTKTTATADHL